MERIEGIYNYNNSLNREFEIKTNPDLDREGGFN